MPTTDSGRDQSPTTVGTLRRRGPFLWVIAILLYGVADVAITRYALWTGTAVEENILMRHLINTEGFVSVVLGKVLLFAFLYLFYRVTRRWQQNFALIFPLVLSVLGAGIFVWNLWILIA